MSNAGNAGKSRFAGLNDTEVGKKGTYLEEGSYELQVEIMQVIATRKIGDCFVLEATVTRSTNPKHPIGSRRSWMQKMGEDTALSNIKGLCYAALGYDHKDPAQAEEIKAKVDPKCEEVMTRAVEDNAFKGTKIGVDVTQVTTKKGNLFSKHMWRPASA